MLTKSFQRFLVCLPLFCILFLIYFGVTVKNTDALTYHLYYSRVISDLHLNFFSDRPVPLANELGFGLSAYYPWLYSHLVSLLHTVFNVSFDAATYLLLALIYCSLMLSYRTNQTRSMLAAYFMMPIIFEYFFVAGTNYVMTSFLAFLAYKSVESVAEKPNFTRYLILIISSYLLINIHVFGIFICLVLLAYGYFVSKSNKFILLSVAFLVIHLVHNYLLTKSITFPFLQSIFPHKNYDFEEWHILESEVKNGILWESQSGGFGRLIISILTPFCISAYIIYAGFIKRKQKTLLLVLMIPCFMIGILAFRHRVIFLSIFMFVFMSIVEREGVSIYDEIQGLWILVKSSILEIILILISLSGLKYAYYDFKDQKNDHVSVTSLKKCFYSAVSDLSLNNKILLTETELYQIRKPENIIAADGRTYSETKTIKSADKFLDYLKSKKIKYVTHTPLSTQEFEFSEKMEFVKFYPELEASEKLKRVKDCPAESHINSQVLPEFANPFFRNWLIYEVK